MQWQCRPTPRATKNVQYAESNAQNFNEQVQDGDDNGNGGGPPPIGV
ncbi:hypothetical protein SAMN05421858_4601 [Haladaptatus litoreus]|uniref:Uncharacterized protein n=1 Tax=Haladaptatus litoreus TaxID=553468 RepID=A0A1N7EX97_9EURY|nr:hypothetical protein [Haladaptatus litoreus]SIR92728.1 hypothetical protein SAMN05421858_4601 [Haladaptatus litoreus]